MAYAHNGIFSALQRNETETLITWINLEDIMLHEINQLQKDKYYTSMYDCTSVASRVVNFIERRKIEWELPVAQGKGMENCLLDIEYQLCHMESF